MSRLHRKALHLALAAALLLPATVLLSACSATQSPATQVSDATITTKIKAKLTGDPDINPFNVDVDTDEGVVRLSGTVEDAYTREEAGKLARNTRGVKYVENELKIGQKTFGERIDDTALTTKVKARLTGDPDINPLNINVDAEDGVIVLTGRVPSAEDRIEAEEVALGTGGVQGVDNRLEVGKEG